MIRLLAPAALGLVLVVATGCPEGAMARHSTMSDSTFIQAMVELRRASTDTSLDSLMRDSTRRVILRRHGITAQQLIGEAEGMASDPERASRIWKVIQDRVNPPYVPGRPRVPGASPTLPTGRP